MSHKLKIKENLFELVSNTDARIKTRKYKLNIKKPNIITIRPKPNGLVLRQIRDTDIFKEDQGTRIKLKKRDQYVIYKQTP